MAFISGTPKKSKLKYVRGMLPDIFGRFSKAINLMWLNFELWVNGNSLIGPKKYKRNVTF